MAPLIYLDHAATTPVRPEVLAAMAPLFESEFGNPSGAHSAARRARRALDDARERLSVVLGCEPAELVFTSGGTEADNLAVTGTALGAVASGADASLVCCSAVEHPAVIEPTRWLGGLELPVDRNGVIDLAVLKAVLAVELERVALVSVMLANNETGVVQPLAEIARVVRELTPGALLHTDAVQALAWLDVASETAAADLVSVSAHKVGGPKGIGALVVRGDARRRLTPMLRGGPQEHELRAGTPNLPGIVGFAVAAELASSERTAAVVTAASLGARLLAEITAVVPDAVPSIRGAERLPSIVSIAFPGVEVEELLVLLDDAGIAASAGSACASGALDPSPVLLAMGMSPTEAKSVLRLSLGRSTTEADVSTAALVIGDSISRLRAG